MQTFLPYADFLTSAKVLDRQRLGKQRLEVIGILQALSEKTRWSHHPAVKMWARYTDCLKLYGRIICMEWISRGYRDSILPRLNGDPTEFVERPEWLGREDFHASHRSNLLRKLPEHYSQFGWAESSNLPYIWPVKVEDKYG